MEVRQIIFMRYDSLKIGGVLYVIAAFQFLVFELVAETLYPGYNVANTTSATWAQIVSLHLVLPAA